MKLILLVLTKCRHDTNTDFAGYTPPFEDNRLSKLFLNFKARNYPQSLNDYEQRPTLS